MQKRTIRDIDVAGKAVLLRVDYNVQVEGGRVQDDLRLRESLPTIDALRKAGARVVIVSHRGRPHGAADEMLRNEPVAQHLSQLLGIQVAVARECIGPKAKAAVDALKPGEVVLLENLRFHVEEEENDEEFARQLAALADVYVNDAFGTAHRAHASIVGVPKFLPSVAGLLLEKEVSILARLGTNPERPLGLVLGGAKIADKIAILNHLCDVTDVICVGGGVGNTFLKARGIDVADSLVDDDGIADAKRVLSRANGQLKVVLPSDAVAAFGGAAGAQIRTVPVTYVPSGWRILDLGPATLDAFHNALAPMRTIVWNGPVGLFEHPPFDIGSLAVARMLAEIGATTIVGGGETAAAVQRAGVAERMAHVSTGGGASLAMLQGKVLPGVEALDDA